MSVEVVSVCNKVPSSPPYQYERGYKASLGRLGINPTILGFGEHWGGLITKPKRLREWIRGGGPKAEYLIYCDAWDIVFQKHPDEILERYLAHWPTAPIVINAERNQFPYVEGAEEAFEDQGTPWRYLNSGFMIGRPEDFLVLLESMGLDGILEDTQFQLPCTVTYGGVTRDYQTDDWFHPNDQLDFTLAYMRQPTPMELDVRAELCVTGHGSALDDFDMSGPKIRVKFTDTVPGVFHFNGGSKNDILEPMFQHWGL